MRFTVEHTLPGTLARLEALIEDPQLYARLEAAMPGMERIELLASDDSGGVLRRRVRYTPRAAERIPSFGRGVITPEMLIWVEDSAFDRAAHRIEYRVEPNLPERWRDRFDSRGCFTFRELAGATPAATPATPAATPAATVIRRVEGEITVRVPVVGALAERVLVKELTAGFDADAAILTSWLA